MTAERDPDHHVEAAPAALHVVVRHDGRVIADSRRPVVLRETGLPDRYYLPETDVEMTALEPSSTHTFCPYKGEADRYWSVRGSQARDVAWSYSDPLPEVGDIAGLIAFYHLGITVTPAEAQASPAQLAEWREFRAAREAELGQRHGWLCLTGFAWLPEQPGSLPGLPGRWWASGGIGYVDADAGDALLVDGRPLAGRSERTVEETGRVPWASHDGTDIELLNRGGRLAVRLRAETSTEREAFDGVPVWDYEPAWVIAGRFHRYPQPRLIEVDTIRPDLRQRIPAVGEVEFDVAGQPQRLVATSIKAGLSIEFHDPTNGTETETWRQLKFDDPAADGSVTLDFNRTNNMWFAFTDFATCPAPSDGQAITVPVRAGEQKPSR